MLAKQSILTGNRRNASALLIGTLVLAVLFVALQFNGFTEIIAEGYYFTGSESSITTSFIYVLVLVHMAHLLAGIITLLVVIYNHFKQRYKKGQMLGIELGATFWHFVDLMWIYLFVFLYFFR
jgi:cytochrome c oxidase subunit 3